MVNDGQADRRSNAADMPAADHAWAAVLARDRRFDGRFVYAVRSTGVFCRPTCPSRRPRPEQVAFFRDAESARRAGFRACRRCQPETAGADPSARVVARVVASLRRSVGSETGQAAFSLARLAREARLSPAYLQRTFKRLVGLSPREYAAALRLERLKQGLRDGRDVAGATYAAGYGSGSRVYEKAGARLGMTPGAYRRGAAGLCVRFVVLTTRLGPLLVAATERGVCAVSWGQSEAALEAALRREYPRAELRHDPRGLARWAADVKRAVESRVRRAAVPLDLPGTAFQVAVWSELRRIPFGQTRSYSQVAEALGRPGAARAVARACASNPTAVLVPCHRVVPADGSNGGYRWGTQRKAALLTAERRQTARR